MLQDLKFFSQIWKYIYENIAGAAELENWQQKCGGNLKVPSALGIACAVFDAWKDCQEQASPLAVRFGTNQPDLLCCK